MKALFVKKGERRALPVSALANGNDRGGVAEGASVDDGILILSKRVGLEGSVFIPKSVLKKAGIRVSYKQEWVEKESE